MDRTATREDIQGIIAFLTANPPVTDLERAALAAYEADPEGAIDRALAEPTAEVTETEGTLETRDLFSAEQIAAAGTRTTVTPDWATHTPAARTEAELAAAIGKTLGYRHTRTIGDHENAACLTLWSVRELQDAHNRIGGTVTARRVVRRYEDGVTAPCIEVVLTADIDGIGSVALNTDWVPADEPYGLGLPIIQSLNIAPAATENPRYVVNQLGLNYFSVWDRNTELDVSVRSTRKWADADAAALNASV